MKEPLYDNILEFQVYGESALFCNPITMVSEEQTSYQVPTYSALQGIMESCYWKPTIYWQPLEVRVMNRIRLCRRRAADVKAAASVDRQRTPVPDQCGV